jgi:hypothetical protein
VPLTKQILNLEDASLSVHAELCCAERDKAHGRGFDRAVRGRNAPTYRSSTGLRDYRRLVIDIDLLLVDALRTYVSVSILQGWNAELDHVGHRLFSIPTWHTEPERMALLDD